MGDILERQVFSQSDVVSGYRKLAQAENVIRISD